MLALVEMFFSIAINVYSLQENGHATIVCLSKLTDFNVMHLHLYEPHFSYISKFRTFAKKYECIICSRILNLSKNLIRHVRECYVDTEGKYVVCGKYRTNKNIFELLEDIDINIPEEDHYNPYFSMYDYEALQVPVDNEILHGCKLHFTHVPATGLSVRTFPAM